MSTSADHNALTNRPTNPAIELFTVYDNMHTKGADWNRGIQLDSIHPSLHSPDSTIRNTASEENDDIGPLPKPLATDASERLTRQCTAMSSVMSDWSRNGRGTAVVQMINNDNMACSPKSTLSRHGTGLSRQLTKLFHRDSSLSVQHIWRKRNATVRMKNSKNFVSFHNIHYTIPQGYFWQRKPPKVILNNVR